MKTAISIPDEVYAHASARAAAMGLSRSEFITRATRRYLEQLDEQSLTRQIDAALDLIREDDSGAAAVAAGRRRLVREDETW